MEECPAQSEVKFLKKLSDIRQFRHPSVHKLPPFCWESISPENRKRYSVDFSLILSPSSICGRLMTSDQSSCVVRV